MESQMELMNYRVFFPVINIHGLDPSKPEDFPFVSHEPLLVLDPKTAAKAVNKQAAKNGNGNGSGLTLVDVHGQ